MIGRPGIHPQRSVPTFCRSTRSRSVPIGSVSGDYSSVWEPFSGPAARVDEDLRRRRSRSGLAAASVVYLFVVPVFTGQFVAIEAATFAAVYRAVFFGFETFAAGAGSLDSDRRRPAGAVEHRRTKDRPRRPPAGSAWSSPRPSRASSPRSRKGSPPTGTQMTSRPRSRRSRSGSRRIPCSSGASSPHSRPSPGPTPSRDSGPPPSRPATPGSAIPGEARQVRGDPDAADPRSRGGVGPNSSPRGPAVRALRGPGHRRPAHRRGRHCVLLARVLLAVAPPTRIPPSPPNAYSSLPRHRVLVRPVRAARAAGSGMTGLQLPHAGTGAVPEPARTVY